MKKLVFMFIAAFMAFSQGSLVSANQVMEDIIQNPEERHIPGR